MASDLLRQLLFEKIALTESHLAQSETNIALQRGRIAWQERTGRDSGASRDLLATYLNVRASHLAHHDSLILEIGEHSGGVQRRAKLRR
jgi:hypothetical protein